MDPSSSRGKRAELAQDLGPSTAEVLRGSWSETRARPVPGYYCCDRARRAGLRRRPARQGPGHRDRALNDGRAASPATAELAGRIHVAFSQGMCEEHDMSPIKGSCLCGGVAFEMTGTPVRVNHCHCSRCRKVRGTGHATNLFVRLPGLRFVRGEDLLTSYKLPDAKFFTHVFCRRCGASMPRIDEGRGFAVVPMGAFDDDPGVRPERHIYVDSKASWDEITDGLPTFPGPPPSP